VGDQVGYNKEKGINTWFDDGGKGFYDFNGNRFYDPMRFFATKGSLIQGVSFNENILKDIKTTNGYTVTFDTQGGSNIASVAVAYGTPVAKPATDPVREGFIFDGWLKGTATYNFDTAVTGNLALTAKWIPITFTVTFDSQGGTAKAAAKVNYGNTVAKPTAPTKTGYTFDNWYLGDSKTPYDFTTPIKADITLTAKWTTN
jgi:uncharacterized repeat protein (TIGR02543 family)